MGDGSSKVTATHGTVTDHDCILKPFYIVRQDHVQGGGYSNYGLYSRIADRRENKGGSLWYRNGITAVNVRNSTVIHAFLLYSGGDYRLVAAVSHPSRHGLLLCKKSRSAKQENKAG
jgi:hypothetical protein